MSVENFEKCLHVLKILEGQMYKYVFMPYHMYEERTENTLLSLLVQVDQKNSIKIM